MSAIEQTCHRLQVCSKPELRVQWDCSGNGRLGSAACACVPQTVPGEMLQAKPKGLCLCVTHDVSARHRVRSTTIAALANSNCLEQQGGVAVTGEKQPVQPE